MNRLKWLTGLNKVEKGLRPNEILFSDEDRKKLNGQKNKSNKHNKNKRLWLRYSRPHLTLFSWIDGLKRTDFRHIDSDI